MTPYYTLLILLLSATSLVAQEIRDLPPRNSGTMEGREFVIGFMQNEVIYQDQLNIERVLTLYIAAELSTTVRIQYGDWDAFTVTVAAGSIHTEDVPEAFMCTRAGRVENKAIFLSASNPVVVYGFNSMQMSTDTYMAIPTQHLGTQYIGVSRGNETYDTSTNKSSFSTRIRQGAMLIASPQSGTRVTITPTVDLEGGMKAGLPFDVVLERGQTYFLKSDEANPQAVSDLTGTIIQSNRPVAVFSGHVRASVYDNILPSHRLQKDHLVEQLIPVDKWGSRHATVPFGVLSSGDQVRIVPSAWPTVIEQILPGGIQTYTIRNRGEFLEINLRQVCFWQSDNPVMVVQMMRTAASSSDRLGDPAMVVVPPVERFSDRALFQVPKLLRQAGSDDRDYRYYVIVVAELEAVPTLRNNGVRLMDIDGNLLMRRVPGTQYCYGFYSVIPDQVYSMVCDQGSFSGVMYGVGPADSYANIFGMSFDGRRRKERTPPQFDLAVKCDSVSGTVRDSTTAFAALQEAWIDRNRTFNYDVELIGPTGPGRTYAMRASVINPWLNARVVVQVYDTMDVGREWDYFYDAPEFRAPIEVQVNAGNAQECQRFSIVNTDTSSMRIDGLEFTGDPRFSTIPQQYSGSIAPGDSLVITVCFDPPRDPAPGPGTLAIRFACDLVHRIPIRAVTNFSLRSEDVDLGIVRLGDTACGSAYIINNGLTSIRLSALDIQASFPEFVVNVAALALPRLLAPNARLEVPVCVVPQTIGTVTRRDTIRSSPNVGSTVGYRVRGVRPDVPSIAMQWPNTRVGVADDSSIVLVNRGDYNARLTRVAVRGNAGAFDISAFSAATLSLDSLSSAVLRVQFVPEVTGTRRAEILYTVDWQPHDTVRVVLEGTGIMPEVNGFDADFGTSPVGVPVPLAKHRTLVVGGNEKLTIDNIEVVGPDATAFVISNDLLNLRSASPGDEKYYDLAFTPQRAGVHTATIRVTHDAAPRFERRTTLILLIGRGVEDSDTVIPPDSTFEGNAALAVVQSAVSCQDYQGTVSVAGRGLIERTVDRIDVFVDGKQVAISGEAFPITLSNGELRSWLFAYESVNKPVFPVEARVVWADGADTTMVESVRVRLHQATVSLDPLGSYVPGRVFSASGTVAVPDEFSRGHSPEILISVDVRKLAIDVSSIRLIHASTLQVVGHTTEYSLGVLTLRSLETLRTPYELTWSFDGLALLSDTQPLTVVAGIRGDDCLEANQVSSSSSLDVCAGAVRMVRLGGGVAVRVPVSVVEGNNAIEVFIESGQSSHVGIGLRDLTGKLSSLWETHTLTSGTTVINFPVSEAASGAYVLHLRHPGGETTFPVIVIK